MALGFPVLCIDRVTQINPAIRAILDWTPGTPFPDDVGAKIPELEMAELPTDQGKLHDMDDYGETYEPVNPADFEDFVELYGACVDPGVGGGDAQ